MLPITVYNQKGGQAKTTITRDLAAAFAEAGLKVLIVDFDSQNASVSNYLGVDDEKYDPDADDISLHLIDRGKGPFEDLIREVDGEENIHVIPSHKRFGNISDYLDQHANYLKPSKPEGWEYPKYKRFKKVLQENNVHEDYDVMLVDPNAKADTAYYLGLYATRNLVIPAKPTRGGFDSISAVENSAKNFANEMDIEISLLATVPTLVKSNKNIHEEYMNAIRQAYPSRSPVYFKHLGVYEKAEENYVTVFDQLKSASRVRDYNGDVMPKFRTLAASLCAHAGYELPADVWEKDDVFLGNEEWAVNATGLPAQFEKVDAEPAEVA